LPAFSLPSAHIHKNLPGIRPREASINPHDFSFRTFSGALLIKPFNYARGMI
jgi:hypothetical protein